MALKAGETLGGKTETSAGAPQSAAITSQVMRALGTPGEFRSVQVRRLWDDRYRVNVLVGKDAASTRVVHSYFVVADETGNIVEANPAITRQH
jgi:hypothetical protein